MLLQRILGMGAHIKRGNGQGKLAKAAAAASASNHSVGGDYFTSCKIVATNNTIFFHTLFLLLYFLIPHNVFLLLNFARFSTLKNVVN